MNITDLLKVQEDLDPELEEHVYQDGAMGPCIKHPLVFSIVHHPQLNAMVNAQLRAKKEAVARAEEKGDWHQFVWLHERPYRLDALLVAKDALASEPEAFWGLAGEVWVDSENIWQNMDEWRDVFETPAWIRPPVRQHFMSEEDRQTMQLPTNKGGVENVVTVYRGFCHEDASDGFSWSLREDTALFFARRAVWRSGEENKPLIATGTVSKRDVIGLMTGRGEFEIVVLPEDVHNILVKEV